MAKFNLPFLEYAAVYGRGKQPRSAARVNAKKIATSYRFLYDLDYICMFADG